MEDVPTTATGPAVIRAVCIDDQTLICSRRAIYCDNVKIQAEGYSPDQILGDAQDERREWPMPSEIEAD
jgi:hypothetical protein